MNKFIQTKTARFLANPPKEVVDITQLSSAVTTHLDVKVTWSLLDTDYSKVDKKSLYCSKANMEITLGANGHLRSSNHIINTYLNPSQVNELKQYILFNFPDINKVSEILTTQKSGVSTVKKQELSREDKIKKFKFLEMAVYEEPYYDNEYCNGYPNHNFIGIIGKNGETIEIDFNAHENLFDPISGDIKNYPVAHAFNLYDENHENLAHRNKLILTCNHIKEEALFQVNLVPTEDIKYYGKLLKAREEYKLAVGKLPQAIKFKNSLSELLEETDDKELPWIE
jgi:hypothetical protein